MKALTAGAIPVHVDINEKNAEEEIDISRMKAAIASRFKIPLEAIDIVASDISGNLVVKHALVFLSSSDIARLSKPTPT
jgi:dTDP-4-amino-4,6-dideoxygalactose transaminase